MGGCGWVCVCGCVSSTTPRGVPAAARRGYRPTPEPPPPSPGHPTRSSSSSSIPPTRLLFAPTHLGVPPGGGGGGTQGRTRTQRPSKGDPRRHPLPRAGNLPACVPPRVTVSPPRVPPRGTRGTPPPPQPRPPQDGVRAGAPRLCGIVPRAREQPVLVGIPRNGGSLSLNLDRENQSLKKCFARCQEEISRICCLLESAAKKRSVFRPAEAVEKPIPGVGSGPSASRVDTNFIACNR